MRNGRGQSRRAGLMAAIVAGATILAAAGPVAAATSVGAGSGEIVATAPGDAEIAFQPIAGGLSKPVFITSARDGTGRMFIVEQSGRIRILKNGSVRSTPFLSLAGKVSTGAEQGLLGLAFHPNYKTNRKLYVHFTNRSGDSVVREYRASATNKNVVATSTKRKILKVDQPFSNHNGGMIAFGPDGYLYIALGDGGSAGDPGNRGQRLDTLLGKILRIDVNGTAGGRNYRIPASNPFVGVSGRDEIWQYGLRNPWRFSFDRATGDLWIGDVGQNEHEEIDRAVRTGSGAGRGTNWGWRVMEGFHCHNPSSGCNTSGKALPLLEYGHGSGRCSVTGGYVYRGAAIPALRGGYVFGDYCSGEIWVVNATASSPASRTLLRDTALQITSFGESASGELYVVHRGGRVYRIVQG